MTDMTCRAGRDLRRHHPWRRVSTAPGSFGTSSLQGRELPDRRQGRFRFRHECRAVAPHPRRHEVPGNRRTWASVAQSTLERNLLLRERAALRRTAADLHSRPFRWTQGRMGGVAHAARLDDGAAQPRGGARSRSGSPSTISMGRVNRVMPKPPVASSAARRSKKCRKSRRASSRAASTTTPRSAGRNGWSRNWSRDGLDASPASGATNGTTLLRTGRRRAPFA